MSANPSPHANKPRKGKKRKGRREREAQRDTPIHAPPQVVALTAASSSAGTSGAALRNAKGLDDATVSVQEHVLVPGQSVGSVVSQGTQSPPSQPAPGQPASTDTNNVVVATTAASTPAGEPKPEVPKTAVNGTEARAKPEESPIIGSFREFVLNEKQRLARKKQAIVKSEKEKRMAELVAFSQNFKLNKPIPEDLVPILTKDSEKAKQIVEKSSQDAASTKARQIGGPQVVTSTSGTLLKKPAPPAVGTASGTATDKVPNAVDQPILSPFPDDWREPAAAAQAATTATEQGNEEPVAGGEDWEPIFTRPTLRQSTSMPAIKTGRGTFASGKVAVTPWPKSKVAGDAPTASPNPFYGTKAPKGSQMTVIKEDFDLFKFAKVARAASVPSNWPYTGRKFLMLFPGPTVPPQLSQPPAQVIQAPQPPPPIQQVATLSVPGLPALTAAKKDGREMPSLNQNEDKAGSQLTPPSPYISMDEHAHAQSHNTVVSSLMSPTEIARVLANHGCPDLTQQLNLNSCSTYAMSSGGFGEVYSGKLTDDTYVAIKVFRLFVADEESRKHLKHAARELHTWSKCQHPNVLGLLGLVEFRGQVGMVSPWIAKGNLRPYVRQWPNTNRYQLCWGVANGLAYLHGVGVIHGDLKGANVLVSNDGIPLITDFGNSVLNDQSLQFTCTTTKHSVSPRWTAPEVLNGSIRSSYSADVFSLGMTLLETMTGNIPYHELVDPAVYMAIAFKREVPVRPETHIPTASNHDDMLWSLLEKCWSFEPEHRPSAERVRDTMLEIVNLNGSLNITIAIGSTAP